MNRLLTFAGLLLAFTLQAWGAAQWQNISYSTNPVTYAVITNVMGFTGSTTTYLRSDGTQATPPGGSSYAVTNYFITPSTGITVATNVTGTNVTWTLSSTVVSGGNMTNSGASVIGMVPVATDTTGTQWTPTNSISLDDVIAGTLSLSNMLANVVPVFDANTNMVPSSMTTNVLNLLYTQSNNLTNWGKLATNSFQAASATLDHYAGTDTNAILAAIGGAALAGATFTGDLAVTGTNVIGALALKAPLASPAITGAPTINGVGIQQPVSALTTTWTAANSASNYVADLSLRGLLFNMTTNLNIIHTTNGTANFTANTITNYMSICVINNSGTNFPVSWPATWHTVGTVGTPFTLTNGDFCSIAIDFKGPSTDQTNNWIGVAYKQY